MQERAKDEIKKDEAVKEHKPSIETFQVAVEKLDEKKKSRLEAIERYTQRADYPYTFISDYAATPFEKFENAIRNMVKDAPESKAAVEDFAAKLNLFHKHSILETSTYKSLVGSQKELTASFEALIKAVNDPEIKQGLEGKREDLIQKAVEQLDRNTDVITKQDLWTKTAVMSEDEFYKRILRLRWKCSTPASPLDDANDYARYRVQVGGNNLSAIKLPSGKSYTHDACEFNIHLNEDDKGKRSISIYPKDEKEYPEKMRHSPEYLGKAITAGMEFLLSQGVEEIELSPPNLEEFKEGVRAAKHPHLMKFWQDSLAANLHQRIYQLEKFQGDFKNQAEPGLTMNKAMEEANINNMVGQKLLRESQGREMIAHLSRLRDRDLSKKADDALTMKPEKATDNDTLSLSAAAKEREKDLKESLKLLAEKEEKETPEARRKQAPETLKALDGSFEKIQEISRREIKSEADLLILTEELNSQLAIIRETNSAVNNIEVVRDKVNKIIKSDDLEKAISNVSAAFENEKELQSNPRLQTAKDELNIHLDLLNMNPHPTILSSSELVSSPVDNNQIQIPGKKQ